jgi:hypothetical protein
MKIARRKTRRAPAVCLLFVLFALFAGCRSNDSSPSAPSETTPGESTPPSFSGGWLRVANMASELLRVDVAVDGNVIFFGLRYPAWSRYIRLDAGTHRIRFFPTASTATAEGSLERTVNVTAGQGVTVATIGLVETHSLQVAVLEDDLSTSRSQVRLRFFNGVPDFPTPLDLAVGDDRVILRGVGFGQRSGYAEIAQGNYDVKALRENNQNVIISIVGQGLAQNATYTVFVFGSLRREDLDGRVVLDAGSDSPALRRY